MPQRRKADVRPVDVVTAAYLAITALVTLYHFSAVPQWAPLAAVQLVAAAAILLLSRLRVPLPKPLGFFRDWYPYFLVLPLYQEVEYLAGAYGNWGLTQPLQDLEVVLFAGHPSMYLSEMLPWPLFSEYLHLSYLSYTILFVCVGGYWYARGLRAEFAELLLVVCATYYASYLFFVLFPVDSPFYLYEKLGPPLSDGPFYKTVHFFSSRGGARGGAFPSLHVSVSTVILCTAWRHQRRLGWVLLPFVIGINIATVYGRFHYVLDVFAGWAVAAAVLVGVRRLPTQPS
ncbi:MAG: phosphatase PAP2 family protein [bacterium]|nr:phosphatase PAP2 family protein [bacterium]